MTVEETETSGKQLVQLQSSALSTTCFCPGGVGSPRPSSGSREGAALRNASWRTLDLCCTLKDQKWAGWKKMDFRQREEFVQRPGELALIPSWGHGLLLSAAFSRVFWGLVLLSWAFTFVLLLISPHPPSLHDLIMPLTSALFANDMSLSSLLRTTQPTAYSTYSSSSLLKGT